jgi:hypothetical protein
VVGRERGTRDFPFERGSCEKIEIKFDFGSPRPNEGEGRCEKIKKSLD